ncbi:hypothetical protein PV350_04695 [Streptomyces sp. PA03-6a]|nr:hypothetical protein [Streptomyces sp. PA03-6a]
MAKSTGGRLIVDGVDLSDEYDDFEAATPSLVHDIPDDGPHLSRVLGPKSFTLLIVNPGDRLYELVDAGKAVHQVTVSASGYSITHPTHFHKGWVGRDGVRRMFGSLAPDRDNEAKWIEERQPVGANADRAEGN